MALQHLYSRVPARASMFNKADGYDTFACSDGLTREFIERELSVVYDYKPSAAETALIRKGELPPLYAQTLTKSGELIQSALGFIASDYTGERSSYVAHTLVFNEKEKNRLLGSLTGSVFNAGNFVTDVTGFDFTSTSARAVYDYPELDYVKKPAEKTEWLATDYDAAVMKRFIFAVLNAVCGKGKPVYPVIAESAAGLSRKALDFISTFMQIMPYHLRGHISFVTYAGDFTKFPSFKVRFLPGDALPPPPAKGVSVNFATKLITGVKNEDYAQMSHVTDFLYSLLTENEVRREFLIFTDHAIAAAPALAAPSLKTVADLVFLFRCCSSMFDENKVLSGDDKVYDFMCVYEKYRAALSDESRVSGMRCLKRYPKQHLAIPKNVFAKVSRLYPQESAGVKRVIMNVVLELIHTDVMRDKLFAFIKNNYDGEDAEMKMTINGDLCRVFYGGFLQPQILEFFARNFLSEPISTRDAVIDKILLAIRTKAVQPQILEFLRAYYSSFTKAQKKQLYATIFEMLPEGDELAGSLIELVDANISDESESFKTEFSDKITAEIDAEQRRKDRPLLKCLTRADGFCTASVVKRIFTDWSGRRIFSEWAEDIALLDADGRLNAIAATLKAVPYMSDETVSKFVAALGDAYRQNPDKGGIFRAIESESKLSERLSAVRGDSVTAFEAKYADTVISPYVCAQMQDFFRIRRPDGVQVLADYAARHPLIEQQEGFALFGNFKALLDAASKGNPADVISFCEKLPVGKTVGQNAAQYLDALLIKSDALSGGAQSDIRALILAVQGRLSTGDYDFQAAFDELKNDKIAAIAASGKKVKDSQAENAETEALNSILFIASTVYKSADEKVKEKLCGENSSLTAALTAFITRGGGKARKTAFDAISRIPGAEKNFTSRLTGAVNAAVPEKKGLLSRLFGK